MTEFDHMPVASLEAQSVARSDLVLESLLVYVNINGPHLAGNEIAAIWSEKYKVLHEAARRLEALVTRAHRAMNRAQRMADSTSAKPQ